MSPVEPSESLATIASRPELRRWQKFYPPGETLFSQGQSAESAFVLFSGVVQLVGDRQGVGFTEGIAGPGEILGERVLTESAPYPRRYGAVAQTDVRALEIPREEFLAFERGAPEVANALYRAALVVTQTRLHRMHYLVRSLRPTPLDRRVAGVVSYFHRTMAALGKTAPVVLNATAVTEYVDLDEAAAERWLEKLEEAGLVVRQATGTYRVTDISGLFDIQENGFQV